MNAPDSFAVNRLLRLYLFVLIVGLLLLDLPDAFGCSL